jgi:Rps23 Pro-64 3,4-dihydroxylase Tpa1-like proline 4-hydroxylase
MKRKAEKQTAPASNGKKQATESNAVEAQFGDNLLAEETLKGYTNDYAASEPYKHAVVHGLMNDNLLRSVRTEIIDNIHFTPKETDIYKIHQSGDLANLSGLPESALEKLPSLLKLRDALYGPEFRRWISTVANSGPLSGKKTDMAVNVYVPGCHLLCHDDVIGSRRVSYILYLTDPDKPWQANWGGALRLYPTDEEKGEDGKLYKVPRAEFSKVIPPAWNQLSFFAVQPGESFHDVEEVYHRAEGVEEDDGGRVRMAISGWFHIPQEGEEGFEPGLEEKLAEKSSLQQLQGKGEQFDDPKPQWIDPEAGNEQPATKEDDDDDDEEEAEMTEEDLQFLLNYMTPNYLTPDTVEDLNELFTEESTAQMANFLNKKLAPRLRKQIEAEAFKREFETSRPPHKHRYQYLASSAAVRPPPVGSEEDPHGDIMYNFLPSLAFRKWLSLTTGLSLKRCTILARKFRRTLDYQLATGYRGEQPQLEYCLNITPTTGWAPEEPEAEPEEDEDDDDDEDEETAPKNKGKGKAKAKAPVPEPKPQPQAEDEDNVGGYELYMAGDDDEDDDDDDAGSDHGVEIPAKFQSATGAGDRRSAKKARAKADPAIYKAAQEDEEDDGILFSNPASWNTLSLVLRDRGVLKFVKYVSGKAKGDRYDFAGAVEVNDIDDEDEDDDDAGEGAAN